MPPTDAPTAIVLAVLASITVPAAAVASPKAEKIYGADGRRVAVIRDTNFGRKIYGRDGRRIATIKRQ
ncbi:hypothetical protein [Methylobacterium mesophilicum]